MSKKGLAINVFVLLALALIALVIIGFIIARSSGTYIKSTSCESAGGKCAEITKCEGKQSFLQGCKKDEVCCISEEG